MLGRGLGQGVGATHASPLPFRNGDMQTPFLVRDFFLFPALRGSAFLFSPPPMAGGGQPSTDPCSHGAGQPSANVSGRYEQGRPTCGPQGVPHVATPESHAVGCAVPSGAQPPTGFIFTPTLALHMSGSVDVGLKSSNGTTVFALRKKRRWLFVGPRLHHS